MLLPTSQTYNTVDFELCTGAILPELIVAYETWAGQFDAYARSALYAADVGSTAVPIAGNIKAPLLNILARTDNVVDVALGQPTVDLLCSNDVDARFLEIETEYGHAGPMIDGHKWAGDLRDFLDETST